jgi:hypothetical protein
VLPLSFVYSLNMRFEPHHFDAVHRDSDGTHLSETQRCWPTGKIEKQVSLRELGLNALQRGAFCEFGLAVLENIAKIDNSDVWRILAFGLEVLLLNFDREANFAAELRS